MASEDHRFDINPTVNFNTNPFSLSFNFELFYVSMIDKTCFEKAVISF